MQPWEYTFYEYFLQVLKLLTQCLTITEYPSILQYPLIEISWNYLTNTRYRHGDVTFLS